MSFEEEITSKVSEIKELKRHLEILEKQDQVSKRKLQSTAAGTYFISLPRNWCKTLGLKKARLLQSRNKKIV
jgi:hypothetical protein